MSDKFGVIDNGRILMDEMIFAAARALATGDPVGALKRISLRDDASALALRGIAMAQLGEFERATMLLGQAARAFGPAHAVARARCLVAQAEVAFAARDLGWPMKVLEQARLTLETHGDFVNATHARYVAIRRLLLIGRLDEAERLLAGLHPASLSPALHAIHELIVAGIAMRRIQAKAAQAALTRAADAADLARIPALAAEVARARSALAVPAARLIRRDEERVLLLEQVEALLRTDALVVDACRYAVGARAGRISFASRPVLFTLVRALGEAWPADVTRDALIARAFRLPLAEESRVRLRVEIGRLRRVLRGVAGVRATGMGFVLVPHHAGEVVVLAQPVEERHAALLALLADGESWSSSALALALGNGQRNVQRALATLAAEGKVQAFGRGRARRWLTSTVPGFTTTLLLPLALAAF